MRILLTIWLCLTVFFCSAQIPSYYNSIDFTSGATAIENQLSNLVSTTHNPLSYSATFNWLKSTDADPVVISNVILMYTGVSENGNYTLGNGNTSNPQVWNREHVYPQSMINTTARSDLHHLRACDATINNNRGNLPFVSGNGNAGQTSGGWYPGDDWKGDVARMVMYVHLRYNEPFTDVGTLNLFLQWNVEDPVSAFEQNRNNRIRSAQGNRNPFIDNPYLATMFWGGTPAQDNWGVTSIHESEPLKVNLYPNPCKQLFTVEVDHHETVDLEVFSTDGQAILHISFVGRKELDISNWSAGLYQVRIRSKETLVSNIICKE